MKKLVASLLLAVAIGAALPTVAHAQGYVRLLDASGNPITSANPLPTGASGGLPQASLTNAVVAIAATSTQITLAGASTHLTIVNPSATATLYVNLTNAAATTSHFPIAPGAAMTWDALPPITGVKAISSSGSINAGVTAW